MQVVPAEGAEALAAVRSLLEEYWNSFGFPARFQNFSTEMATLPGEYAGARGRLALGWVDGRIAGCVAMRPVDEYRAEAKRLYVRPQFRGLGLGRALIEWVIDQAREAGYVELIGDSLPIMRNAIALYDRIGFERTESPGADGMIYLRLRL